MIAALFLAMWEILILQNWSEMLNGSFSVIHSAQFWLTFTHTFTLIFTFTHAHDIDIALYMYCQWIHSHLDVFVLSKPPHTPRQLFPSFLPSTSHHLHLLSFPLCFCSTSFSFAFRQSKTPQRHTHTEADKLLYSRLNSQLKFMDAHGFDVVVF